MSSEDNDDYIYNTMKKCVSNIYYPYNTPRTNGDTKSSFSLDAVKIFFEHKTYKHRHTPTYLHQQQ